MNAPRGTSSVTVTVAIPRPSSSARRKPEYVSPWTQSFTITLNGTLAAEVDVDPSVSSCSAQAQAIACSAQIAAPIGSDTFVLSLYGGVHGNGPVLSTGSTTQTVGPNVINAVQVALRGVVASTAVSLASPSPQMGAGSTTTVTVKAFDAAGMQIIGSTPYATPLTLVDSDSSGATSLSATTVTSPADAAPTLTYNGTAFVDASVTAIVPGAHTNTTAGVLEPMLRAIEYPVPSGNATNNRLGAGSLTVGSDGAIWFIDDTAIGRVTMSGTVTEYPISATPYGIVSGSDNALWFTESGPAVGRLTTGGALHAYANSAYGQAIASGADGSLGYLAQISPEALGRVTTGGSQSSIPLQLPSGSYGVSSALLVAGSDGSYWSADGQGNVARISPSGVVTLFPLPTGMSSVIAMTSGSDGALRIANGFWIARVTTNGTVTGSYPIVSSAFSSSYQLGQTADGALWYPGLGGSGAAIGRLDATGNAATFVIPNSQPGPPYYATAQPTGFLGGPDGNLWYTRGAAIG
jgi:virginiamycin B lyase